MQRVAQEMNLSETAFVLPRDDGYGLRWFTPGIEVDLCGHATLSPAHVLWETGRLAANQTARFFTRSGWLSAVQNGKLIEMDFPMKPAETVESPPDLLAALGAQAVAVGRNAYDYLVELRTADEVRKLKPDFGRLAMVPVRGTIVTAQSDDPRYDFVSRFFAPAVGVPEDPVTGSAHCCLGPYWAAKLGKGELVGFQSSVRGGVVHVRCAGPRVHLSGTAHTIVRGELLV
jgi:PhzF family phenazine biosynthesis protein